MLLLLVIILQRKPIESKQPDRSLEKECHCLRHMKSLNECAAGRCLNISDEQGINTYEVEILLFKVFPLSKEV